MKQAKRVLTLLLLAATLVSALAMTAYAANTTPEEFDVYVQIMNDFADVARRRKENKTTVYFYPETSTPVVTGNLQPIRTLHVSVYGSADAPGVSSANFTQVNGEIKAYVTCRVGTQYSIYNTVKEAGYTYAYLRIANGNDSTTVPTIVEGVWSPNSTRTYTVAT